MLPMYTWSVAPAPVVAMRSADPLAPASTDQLGARPQDHVVAAQHRRCCRCTPGPSLRPQLWLRIGRPIGAHVEEELGAPPQDHVVAADPVDVAECIARTDIRDGRTPRLPTGEEPNRLNHAGGIASERARRPRGPGVRDRGLFAGSGPGADPKVEMCSRARQHHSPQAGASYDGLADV